MIIGKLIKPCKICLYEKEDGGEIESFSLLKLTFQEACSLLLKSEQFKKEKEFPLDGTVVIKYSGNDEVHQLWKEIAVEHEKNSPKQFLDVSAKFQTTITGTSCLIRDAKNHVIRIALRNGDDKVTINRICIDNNIRERFFCDVKSTKYFKEHKKYAMDTRDLDIYTYWSKFMNTSFITQYKEYSVNKNKK
jgi:hypothetical protein